MSAPQPFGLPPATLDKLNSVFARHGGIESVLIFGSRAKGNYRPGSDIDLTIMNAEITFMEFMQIENQIDDLMLPYTVDLSQYRQIENADLIAHIDRVGVEVYAKSAERFSVTTENLARIKSSAHSTRIISHAALPP